MKNDAAYALEEALENYLKKLEPNDTETLTLIKEYLERCSSAIKARRPSSSCAGRTAVAPVNRTSPCCDKGRVINLFEQLLLKICPTQQWLVLLTDYTEPP